MLGVRTHILRFMGLSYVSCGPLNSGIVSRDALRRAVGACPDFDSALAGLLHEGALLEASNPQGSSELALSPQLRLDLLTVSVLRHWRGLAEAGASREEQVLAESGCREELTAVAAYCLAHAEAVDEALWPRLADICAVLCGEGFEPQLVSAVTTSGRDALSLAAVLFGHAIAAVAVR